MILCTGKVRDKDLGDFKNLNGMVKIFKISANKFKKSKENFMSLRLVHSLTRLILLIHD